MTETIPENIQNIINRVQAQTTRIAPIQNSNEIESLINNCIHEETGLIDLDKVVSLYKGQKNSFHTVKTGLINYDPENQANTWFRGTDSKQNLRCSFDILHTIRTPIDTELKIISNDCVMFKKQMVANEPVLLNLPVAPAGFSHIQLHFDPDTEYEYTFLDYRLPDDPLGKMLKNPDLRFISPCTNIVYGCGYIFQRISN